MSGEETRDREGVSIDDIPPKRFFLSGVWDGFWSGAIISFLGIIFFLLLIPTGLIPGGHEVHKPTTYTGFTKIKPSYPTISMFTDGSFYSEFTSGVGINITIIEEDVRIYLFPEKDNISCGKITLENSRLIPIGSNFILKAEDCIEGKEYQAYSLDIEIPYTVKMGGISTNHTEFGRIHGSYINP